MSSGRKRSRELELLISPTDYRSNRYSNPTLQSNDIRCNGVRKLFEETPVANRSKSKRLDQNVNGNSRKEYSFSGPDSSSVNLSVKLDCEDLKQRHNAILLLWKILDYPDAAERKKNQTVLYIRNTLGISKNSHTAVEKILIGAAIDANGKTIYKKKQINHEGPVSEILEMSLEANIVYRCQDRGLSAAQTALFVNKMRERVWAALQAVGWERGYGCKT
jgi:hypothetical protein